MADKKIIAVLGATGAQGGGLVRAILADPKGPFRARALLRDPASDKAKALAQQGVEVVKADLDDRASITKGFQGAYGAYCVTFYYEHFSPQRETAWGETLARSSKEAGIQHAIWSTFRDSRKDVPLDDDRMPTLMGQYKVPHFEAKAEADQAFTELGVPTTFLYTSFYWDNMIHFGAGPKPGPDGVLTLTLPMGTAKMPGIAAEDIGHCAYGIFTRGKELIGKTIGVAGEHLTGAEMAAGLAKALGREVRYYDVDPDVYRGFGFPGAEDMGNMFQYKRDFEGIYCGARDVQRSRELYPGLQTYAQWLEKNVDRIPLD